MIAICLCAALLLKVASHNRKGDVVNLSHDSPRCAQLR